MCGINFINIMQGQGCGSFPNFQGMFMGNPQGLDLGNLLNGGGCCCQGPRKMPPPPQAHCHCGDTNKYDAKIAKYDMISNIVGMGLQAFNPTQMLGLGGLC